MKTYLTHHFQIFNYHFFISINYFLLTIIINFYYSNQWVYIYIKPFLKYLSINYLITTNLTEIFYIKWILILTISFLFFIFFSLWQYFWFLSPGLYKTENIKSFMLLSNITIFIIITSLINFKYFLPLIINFFLTYYNSLELSICNIFFEPRLSTYLLFSLKLFFWFNMLMLYPIIIIYLIQNNILKKQLIIKYRRYIYFTFWILASLISPPDVYSQILLSVILILISESIIFLHIIYQYIKH